MLTRSEESEILQISPAAGSRPARRSVLTVTAACLGLALVGGLSGCTEPEPPAAPAPSPDELAVDRAVASARQLRTDALALAATNHQLATRLRRIAAVHEAHLKALGAPATPATPASSSPTADPSATASADPSTAPSVAARTAAQLLKAESAAARIALRDGEAAAPAFAVLLCRIAAARAVNADLIAQAIGRGPQPVLVPAAASSTGKPAASSTTAAAAGSGSSDPAPSEPALTGASPSGSAAPADSAADAGTLTALNRLLAGQHVAVFGYPLIIARTTGRRHALARSLWQAHHEDRDHLVALLLAAGTEPAVSQPAYDVGTAPTGTAQAAMLAAKVERGLAALAADVVAVAPVGKKRDTGADQLVLAARRTAAWTGAPAPFPGLSGPPPSASTATPTNLQP